MNTQMRAYINGKLSAFQAEDMGSIPVARLCLNKSASLIVSISNGLGGGGAKQKTLFLSEAKNGAT